VDNKKPLVRDNNQGAARPFTFNPEEWSVTHPHKPFIVWAEARTASTALSAALRAASDLPVWDEPFMFFSKLPTADTPRIYERWRTTRDITPLLEMCERGVCVKHIAEPFEDGFNVQLALAANNAGYRHIRLDRRDTFAQMASRGVAEQLGAWVPSVALERFKLIAQLEALDVGALRRTWEVGQAKWRTVSAALPEWLNLWTEDVTSWMAVHRRATLCRLLRYLEIPAERLGVVDELLFESGQGTDAVLGRVPNVTELLGAFQ
jgi:hypothetical protein